MWQDRTNNAIGHIMSEVIDDDTPNRKFQGLIGVRYTSARP
jgi:hypothetical protein